MSMRRLCLESGRATGLSELPKRKVRCLVCGRLVRIVSRGEHLVVGRHYVLSPMVQTYRNVFEGTF